MGRAHPPHSDGQGRAVLTFGFLDSLFLILGVKLISVSLHWRSLAPIKLIFIINCQSKHRVLWPHEVPFPFLSWDVSERLYSYAKGNSKGKWDGAILAQFWKAQFHLYTPVKMKGGLKTEFSLVSMSCFMRLRIPLLYFHHRHPA